MKGIKPMSKTDEIKPKAKSHYDQLAEKGIIWLNEGVDDEIMGEIASKMLLMSLEDKKRDIYLLINSPGGSITSGLMLYDVIQSIPNKVITIAVGMAASMGQFLLTIGEPGRRYITRSARVLLHQPLGGIHGTATEALIELELITSMKDQLAGITANRTNKTIEEVHEDGHHDHWFTSEQALEYGFADHIVENIHEVLKDAL